MADKPIAGFMERLFSIEKSERAVHALERIADALDRAFPPVRILRPSDAPTEETIAAPTDEELYEWELKEKQRTQAPPPAEEGNPQAPDPNQSE